jgi:cell division protein FtsZ
MFEIEDVGRPVAKIRVIGVGGGGGNALNSMVSANIYGVEFIAVNTDIQHLESSLAPTRIQIGEGLTRGLGAGSNPAIGRDAALESKEAIAGYLKGADMVFITAGLGGGTGTGAAPVIASIAKELGILTVAIVTKPFFFEGKKRALNAEEGARELRQNVNTMIVIPNDRISLVVEKGTSLLQSFATVNDVLRQAVQGISDLVLVPGLINLDFADIRSIMQKAGRAVIGMGMANGEGGAYEAARKAILNPLLEKSSIEGARGILINITGGLNISLDEIQEAASLIHDNAHEEAHIILGAVIDPTLTDEIRVTVIATGIDEKGEIVELPETTVWKPKAETAPLKASSAMLSKDVNILSDGLDAAAAVAEVSKPMQAPEPEEEKALKEAAPEAAEEEEAAVMPLKFEPMAEPGTETGREADIEGVRGKAPERRQEDLLSAYAALNMKPCEHASSISAEPEKEAAPAAKAEPAEAVAGRVEAPAAKEAPAEKSAFSSDMSVSAIPPEDKYDLPSFLRRKY